ncbi:C40 family peptidase [Mucilaginibacter myungsuensis]|uniref:C40 family peptidase n=1 Tax=Mucilaginibacter myungsuensis TaxID=649104 RepID=A0A929L1D2_9SPHI|nr:NlpC/P60 family protein [Mucilaginibacter myungsuensis]MBE9662699.1 C40 family peptidase [Mucilaginibacter myungsuensis]MDN3598119.1 NlpC/P60 family protein [Mucilaginibacter myungsuensis]
MLIRQKYAAFLLLISLTGCIERPERRSASSGSLADTAVMTPYEAEHISEIKTGKTTPLELREFACSLQGIPYKYASIDPKQGFDCSGFVTYVFNHFDIMVPRTSVDFTPVEHPIELKDAKMGDLILFTGTDSTDRTVGHMGIISSLPTEELKFIHSTSGKNKGVVETPLNAYYQGRYVKTLRIFAQNND